MNSCTSGRVYDHTQHVKDYEWSIKDVKIFQTQIRPGATEKEYSISLNLRHTEAFPYSNIWIRFNGITPSGKKISERIPLTLAAEDGHWLGTGVGDIYHSRFTIIKSIIFSEEGKYTFSIQHDMRPDVVSGIMDIGLRIDEVKN